MVRFTNGSKMTINQLRKKFLKRSEDIKELKDRMEDLESQVDELRSELSVSGTVNLSGAIDSWVEDNQRAIYRAIKDKLDQESPDVESLVEDAIKSVDFSQEVEEKVDEKLKEALEDNDKIHSIVERMAREVVEGAVHACVDKLIEGKRLQTLVTAITRGEVLDLLLKQAGTQPKETKEPGVVEKLHGLIQRLF